MAKVESSYTLAPDKTTFATRDQFFVPRLSVDPNHTTCSICLCEYGSDQDGEGAEYPVKIDIPGCNHVFGHRCLLDLIQRPETSLNKCPLCRTKWWQTPEDYEIWQEDWDDGTEEALPSYYYRLHAERIRNHARSRMGQLTSRIFSVGKPRQETTTNSRHRNVPTANQVNQARLHLDRFYEDCCNELRAELREQGQDYPAEECEARRDEARMLLMESWTAVLGTWKCTFTHSLRDYDNRELGRVEHERGQPCSICVFEAADVQNITRSLDVFEAPRGFLEKLSGRRSLHIIHA